MQKLSDVNAAELETRFKKQDKEVVAEIAEMLENVRALDVVYEELYEESKNTFIGFNEQSYQEITGYMELAT